MAASEAELRQKIVEAGKRLHARFFVASNDGNISARLSEDRFLITPTSVNKGDLAPADLLLVDAQGAVLSGTRKPTSEMKMHLAIYRARQNICAVVHTHAVHASIVAVTGGEIPPLLDDQVAFLGGEIKVADYALPGSPELAANAVAALGPRNAALLANHGALAVGRDLSEAFDNCELLEKTARIYALARMIGDVRPLPPHAIEAGKAAYAAKFGDAGASAF